MAGKMRQQQTDAWKKMIDALEKFRKLHGHCRVPTNYTDCPALGRWAAAQRYKKNVGELSADKVRILNKLGFVWSPSDERWSDMLSALNAFKAKYGHCNVPEHWPENQALANWVQNQRWKAKKGKLPQEKVVQLKKAGFQWSVYRQTEEEKFSLNKISDDKGGDDFCTERLYIVRDSVCVQHNGKKPLPKEIEEFRKTHRGDMPPFIPLPKGPTIFFLGDGFVKEKKLKWSGKGPIPRDVMVYVQRNGTLPKYATLET